LLVVPPAESTLKHFFREMLNRMIEDVIMHSPAQRARTTIPSFLNRRPILHPCVRSKGRLYRVSARQEGILDRS